MENRAVCPLYGALGGDLVGSIYEFWTIKTKEFELVADECCLTDDSTLTMATADAILGGKAEYALYYHTWGNRHPNMGYGGRFLSWLQQPFEKAYDYGSWGNGAAMRVSPVGWLFNNEETVRREAERTAKVSHSHPEGIKGAQVTALAIFYLRTMKSMKPVENILSSFYTKEELTAIPEKGEWCDNCQGCVPLSLMLLLQSTSFEDAIRRAVSYGGDSDTVGAIVGSLAEALYGIPEDFKEKALTYLPNDMKEVIHKFNQTIFTMTEERKRRFREADFAVTNPKTGKTRVVKASQDITNRKPIKKK